MLLDPSCVRCQRPFTAPLPSWAATALCDCCSDYVLAYVASSECVHQAITRTKASRRLYARAAAAPATTTRPDACEADTDPLTPADRATLASAVIIAVMDSRPAFHTPIRSEDIWASVEAGERAAAARFKADASAPGFDG